jgi:predicted transcriptional regulator
MKTLTITLPDDTAKRVADAAKELGISAENLVESSVEEKLERLSVSFGDAARRVLKKNAELYRRLG